MIPLLALGVKIVSLIKITIIKFDNSHTAVMQIPLRSATLKFVQVNTHYSKKLYLRCPDTCDVALLRSRFGRCLSGFVEFEQSGACFYLPNCICGNIHQMIEVKKDICLAKLITAHLRRNARSGGVGDSCQSQNRMNLLVIGGENWEQSPLKV